ncbi:Zn-ribbon domain-containing OB-fold protein [Xanthobacter aminoxidans]|uniref:OB-fold domain-containing protein n=1 Tax=Xanthobacter aminoxidans TaxID=186280 RepID=A0ABW6ZQV7_9HYPH
MVERAIPSPVIDAESAPFYAAAREGRFLVRRCTETGRFHWYPRALCPFSLKETEWVEASGRGEIYSYSVMRRSDPPYAIAYVRLEEGPVMLTNIVECDFDALAVGQKVGLVFVPTAGEGTPVPCFRVVRP